MGIKRRSRRRRKRELTIKLMTATVVIFIFIMISVLLDQNNEKKEETKSKPKQETTVEKPEPITEATEDIILGVREWLQNPELPTGCESVALTSVLEYYGYHDLTKTDIAKNYLIYSNTGDPQDGFVGDPTEKSGCGCFANTIVRTANKYLRAKDSNYRAYDVSGINLDQMYEYLDNDTPVMVWNTINMYEPTIDYSSYPVGNNSFYIYEHCVVLIGYNLGKDVFYVMDPLNGIVERNIDEFYDIYQKIGKYAVVILD